MTSKLTREQLRERAQLKAKNLTYAISQSAFAGVRSELEEELQFLQCALACLEGVNSEPVAWTDEQELRDVEKEGCGYLFKASPITPHADPRRVILLYRHAQPAPVVPEEATPDSIEILASARRRDHAVFQWNEDQRNAAADSWNACRAAMLQAQPDDDGEPTYDERIMTIEGILNCERCGDEGWIVGEMGITRCACSQAGNSPVITDG
ncbi:hypothetical protein [Klebsiella quasipneumoniae]|uniref:hypothetical protein n=1 Tax=Klebsiella quasipneumoniae TaxID=1463165 RepID=UPI001887AFF4|nr:hypothetical protein [Klebsiella quasipneumoniae]